MRQQHYRFAHQVLMSAVLRDAAGWFAQAATNGNAMIQEAWASAAEGLSPQHCADGSSLTIAPLAPAPGVDALIVTLPAPMSPTECYFIAVVRVDDRAPRYFVAERGFDADGGVARAYWAEWKNIPLGLVRIRGEDLPTITPEALVQCAVEEVRALGVPNKPLPKKRNHGRMIGAIGLVVALGLIGSLVYLEEIRDTRAPTAEVASVALNLIGKRGAPFSINFGWEGMGHATNNIWLVVDEGKSEGGKFHAVAEIQCDTGPSQIRRIELPSDRAHNVVAGPKDQFSAWIWFESEYHRHSPTPHTCKGIITPETGSWTKARIVVTQSQRPSDWISN